MRPCTCHPDEAPKPCQHKYALGDCMAAAVIRNIMRESKPLGPEFEKAYDDNAGELYET